MSRLFLFWNHIVKKQATFDVLWRPEQGDLCSQSELFSVPLMQAWFETMAGITHVASEVETSGEWEETGSSFMPLGEKGPAFDYTEDNVVERTYLYIQMEYCPRLILLLLIIDKYAKLNIC